MNQTPRTAAGLPSRLAVPIFIVVAALFLGSLGYFFKISSSQEGAAFGRNALQQANAPTSAMGGSDTKAAQLPQTVTVQSGSGPVRGAPIEDGPEAAGEPAGAPPGPVMAEVQRYRTQLERNPNDVEALMGLGKLELQAGMYAKAEEGFARAARLQPSNAEALYGEGTAAQALGQRDRAITAYKRVLDAAPSDPRAKDARAALQTLGAAANP
ncbi:tetratricopeptide repeat protein [bacterium]|nr:MAG: tetratricopeptide repeat protein [bacterium]